MSDKFASVRKPPSHVTADGSRVFLPPPNAQEKALFFSRSVAKHNLLESDQSSGISKEDDVINENQVELNGEDQDSRIDESKIVHPLVRASAMIETYGISELSKAINLSSLVQSGEYFAFGNIVESSLISDKGEKSSAVRSVSSGTAAGLVSSVVAPEGDQVLDQEDMKLRSNFVLKRKQKQFFDAKEALYQHHKRLKVAVTAQRVIDRRFMALRGKWRIAVPEHPSIPVPVRPDEVVCIDVDIYSGNIDGEKHGIISRKVPKYATIELSDDFDITSELKKRKEEYRIIEYERHRADVVSNMIESSSMKGKKSPRKAAIEEEPVRNVTKALPFAVPDPTDGDVDFEFDPENVPILTLMIQIEKASTGFLHTVSLDSFPDHSTVSDDAVLQSLQHSLFCANIFDMIRHELNPTSDSRTPIFHGSHQMKIHHPSFHPAPAWLCADMDENFLPPPSFMSSHRSISSRYGNLISSPLSVIYCHHGEVKVQLNSEYALIVKLEDTKKDSETTEDSKHLEELENLYSGSQSREQLDFLCRILLLNVQSVFHHYEKRSETEEMFQVEKELDNRTVRVDYSVGTSSVSLNNKKKSSKDPYPILQSTVALGLKFLLEQEILNILKEMKALQEEKYPELIFQVDYLKLPIFGSHAQFLICFFESHILDISLSGGEISVTGCTDSYRNICFESSNEFKLFLQLEMERCIKFKNSD